MSVLVPAIWNDNMITGILERKLLRYMHFKQIKWKYTRVLKISANLHGYVVFI
jgi:hypothetical protein